MDTPDALRLVRGLAAAADAAASGPWHRVHADAVGYMSASFIATVESDDFPGANNIVAATYLAPDWATHPQEEANGNFIVAARNSVPILCSLLEELLAARRELRQSLQSLLKCTEQSQHYTPLERDQAIAEANRVLDGSSLPSVD